jgi:hypothetical protein
MWIMSNSVFVVFSDDNKIAGIYQNEEEASSAAQTINGEYDKYAINDDYEEIVYLAVPVSTAEYEEIMSFCFEQSLSPTAFFRTAILEYLAK